MQNKWYKNNDNDIIWWKDTSDMTGVWIFSFDKIKEFNMFRDYPDKLSSGQKQLFDIENPYWADFFSDR